MRRLLSWYRTALLTLLAAVAWQLWLTAPSPPDRTDTSPDLLAQPSVLPMPPPTGPAPQNPSPMSDTTRPHPRLSRNDVPGRRFPLSIGSLYLAPGFVLQPSVPVLVHFHGAAWVLEHHVSQAAPGVALVTVQLGAGSRVYANAFAEPARLVSLLIEAGARLSRLAGYPVQWQAVGVSSFSAGYGAVRSILQHRDQAQRIDGVLLADSLHASYNIRLMPDATTVGDPSSGRTAVGDASRGRMTDLPIETASLEPFIDFARQAVAGKKWMWVTHSEVYPGTYASTTETADLLLSELGLKRRPILRAGPIGMQQLSEAARGNFYLAGFAGNSAPDHLDHLYALDQWLRRWRALAAPSAPVPTS